MFARREPPATPCDAHGTLTLWRSPLSSNMGSGVRFGGDGFVEVLAATQTPSATEWFQGTADAVRQYTWLLGDIKNRTIEDVVILSGDHL